MSNRLRWKKHPKETGLASIGRDSSKRASSYTDGTTEYGSVYAHDYSHLNQGMKGWFWVMHTGVPYCNTCAESIETQKEAKAAAVAYFLKHRSAA